MEQQSEKEALANIQTMSDRDLADIIRVQATMGNEGFYQSVCLLVMILRANNWPMTAKAFDFFYCNNDITPEEKGAA